MAALFWEAFAEVFDTVSGMLIGGVVGVIVDNAVGNKLLQFAFAALGRSSLQASLVITVLGAAVWLLGVAAVLWVGSLFPMFGTLMPSTGGLVIGSLTFMPNYVGQVGAVLNAAAAPINALVNEGIQAEAKSVF